MIVLQIKVSRHACVTNVNLDSFIDHRGNLIITIMVLVFYDFLESMAMYLCAWRALLDILKLKCHYLDFWQATTLYLYFEGGFKTLPTTILHDQLREKNRLILYCSDD